MRHAWGLCALAMHLALLSAAPASAQVSGSVAVLSDYRYRGISLSDERPVAQLTLAYDHPGGAYAGVLASSLHHAYDGSADTLLLPYLGYARRLRGGTSAEVGIQYRRFLRAHLYDHAEVYAGLRWQRFGARLYYAPHYFGQTSVAYLELSATQPFSDRLRLFGHVGLSHSRDHDGGDTDRNHVDLRVGLSWALRGFDVQLAWTAVDTEAAGPVNPPWNRADKTGWVLGVSRSW